jgi:hypothetical protein
MLQLVVANKIESIEFHETKVCRTKEHEVITD